MNKILLTISILVPSISVAQQICDKTIERYVDPADPYHYQARSGVYCEGTVARKPVSGRNFQVVSILKSQLRFGTSDQEVTISAPNYPRSINIEARTKNHTYRLDSQIAPNGIFRWLLSNVVKPKNFQPSQLFLIGYSGSKENPLYVPLQLNTNTYQTSNGTPIVSLIADEELEKIVWRYAPVLNGSRTGDFSKWIPINDGASFTAESRIDVRLITSPSLAKGEYIIDVTGQAVDNGGDRKRTESFRVWID